MSWNDETGALKPIYRPLPTSLPGSASQTTSAAYLQLVLPILGVLIAFPLVLSDNLYLRILLAVTIAGLLFVNRRTSWIAVLSMIYLATLGGIRRNLIPLLGEQKYDPLILVVPAVIGLYFLGTAFTGKLTIKTWFEKLRLLLLLMMFAEVFNPKQGGVIVGLGGVLFYMIPILWSFVGRNVATRENMLVLFYLIVIVGVLGALYGFKQSLFGMSPGEQAWILKSGEASLYLSGDETRPFSFFTNSSEYASFLVLAIVLSFALAVRVNLMWAAPLPLFAIALLFTGVRAPVVIATASCIMIWAVQGRTLKSWIPRGALALVLAVAGLIYGLKTASENISSAAVQHDTQGLLNPADAKKSTAGKHAAMIENGVATGFLNPIGMGLGATTLAAARLGGTGYNSEFDVSNMFISLGCVGGGIWVIFILSTLYQAFRSWHLRRSTAALCILAVLFSHIGGWLNGGNYSIAMIAWFCIGGIYALDMAAVGGPNRPAALSAGSAQLGPPLARRRSVGRSLR